MGVFDRIEAEDHEQVVFNHDRQSGLRSIVAIHSTALGPALGGTRFYPFASEEEALADVLRLSKAMTYKAAAAGLDLGGGKAVIIGDPRRDKSEALLRAYGRFIDTLGGRYITAEDVGTAREDMDTVRRETRWVTGISEFYGGSGDPSPVTAMGVYEGMRAITLELFNDPELKGRRVAVQGVGKVGMALVKLLVEAGAKVVVADVDIDNLSKAVSDYGVETVDISAIHSVECDIFAPCALGGALNEETIPELRCAAVGGAANNQISASDGVKLLAERGILWAPDFIINAGGLINVADELRGYEPERALAQVRGIHRTLRDIFRRASLEKSTTAMAAERLAEARIREVGRIKMIQVGTRPSQQ